MERERGERRREQTWPDSAEPRTQHDGAEKECAQENEWNRQRERENVSTEVTGTFKLPEAVEAKRATNQEQYHTTHTVIAVAASAAFVAALAYAV